MKFLVTFALVVVFAVAINGGAIPEELKETFLELKAACRKEVPELDDAHAEQLKKHELVDDPAVKKFLFCFNKKIHVQNDEGAVDAEKAKEKLAIWVGNHDHDKDVDECAKDLHHDGPENAWALASCLKPKLPKHE